MALAATWIGYLAVAQSIAASSAAGLEQAHRLAPGQARVAARLSEQLSGSEASAVDRARADRLARAALMRDPTAVEAAATLGLNALLRGDTAGGERILRYAQRLSRRDMRTQLWAIESAVSRDDVPGTLKAYDITLRTKPWLAEIMYPVLAPAASDPTIQAALVHTLSKQPSWTASFLEYLVSGGRDPRAAVSLLRTLQRKRVPVSDGVKTAAVNALLSAGHVEPAWSYYTFVRNGGDRRGSRDPNFALEILDPTPFDWVPSNDPAISATIQRGVAGGVFNFSAPASLGGELLQQNQLLPPGTYALTGHSTGIAQPEEARPYWLLRCSDGRELGRAVLPNSDVDQGRFGGRFIVPAGCPMQTLVLIARPSNEIGGLSGQIDRTLLRRAR